MNRTLRRPMFRMGGTAEGITSGLDYPQPNASRPGYNRGRVVNPGGYAGETIGEEYDETWKILQGIRPERKSYLPQFLMSAGLDLATRPASGNIFQQIATSAKGPLDKWMDHRASRYDTDDKLSAALFGDILDIRAKRDLQRKKLASEKEIAEIDAASGDKKYDPGAPAKTAELIEKLDDEYNELTRKGEELKKISPMNRTKEEQLEYENIYGMMDNQGNVISKGRLQSINTTRDKILGTKKQGLFEKIALLEQGENLNDFIQDNIDAGMPYEEALDNALKKMEAALANYSSGGRVGYQMGGMSLPSAAPAALPAAVPVAGTMDQRAGQDDSVQDLSFEELRARLPQEITDDIIHLIANSKQALVDFANIRTQQDVNSFNQKYDVNLVAPQEA